MCGITGAFTFDNQGSIYFNNAEAALDKLRLRGPDAKGIKNFKHSVLCHSRLSIIDVSDAAQQPFTDSSGRYTIVFNGEIFNFKELRKEVEPKHKFRSNSDTEVLLYQYIEHGSECLSKLNGFFAFAIYDSQLHTLFVARDRYGIKPLHYYVDDHIFLFASELKSLLSWGIPRVLDQTSLVQYFQFSYIPAPYSIFENVRKLEPGHFLQIAENKICKGCYYHLGQLYSEPFSGKYLQAQKQLETLLEDSVKLRLISDVPLGAFLSGGIDSSVMVALASKHTPNLATFSIGFKDEPHFDETHYANLVAKKFKTNHTTFSLTNEDLYANLHQVLDYIDEPFADSSALNVHILSMHTRKHVTVALSGDGADEILGGYNKHAALFRASQNTVYNKILTRSNRLWATLPKSRNTKYTNLFRQLEKFSSGLKLSQEERYWQWASFMLEIEAKQLGKLSNDTEYDARKRRILHRLHGQTTMKNVFETDMDLVLQNDMLVKVDLMSMASSLEVRVPFLDYRVVEFLFSLPDNFKISESGRKRVLRDAFKYILPPELYHRPKKGFEVPLLKWFRTSLKTDITENLLNENFIKEQGILEPETVKSIQQRLFSNNPGDAATHAWSLIVFQHWWRKYMS